MDSKNIDHFQWQLFKPTLCLQIVVYGVCVYYDILAVAGIFVGLSRFSSTPTEGYFAKQFPAIFQIIQLTGWAWLTLGGLLLVTGGLGKLAARTTSRILLGIVTVLQLLITAALISAAVLLERGNTVPAGSAATASNEELDRLRTAELPKLMRIAAGLAGSTLLGFLVTLILFVMVCRQKRTAAKLFSYGNLVELEEQEY